MPEAYVNQTISGRKYRGFRAIARGVSVYFTDRDRGSSEPLSNSGAASLPSSSVVRAPQYLSTALYYLVLARFVEIIEPM